MVIEIFQTLTCIHIETETITQGPSKALGTKKGQMGNKLYIQESNGMSHVTTSKIQLTNYNKKNRNNLSSYANNGMSYISFI